MVGIVIASHGDFANGIYQSAQMIFGEQKNVVTCTLMSNESPDDIRGKMEKAIESFEDKDQVLFLVDLWSGTPFNQASALINGKEDKWAIVTGLNLPMLVEAYGARLSMDTAHEVAKSIIDLAKDGIKIKPEKLESKGNKTSVSTTKGGGIPEGTVIGDGQIKYVLARIDTRLLHGQVATSWTKTLNPNRIIAVSDNVSKDELRKNMIEQAAPPGVKANVVPISKMIQVDKDPRFGNVKAMLLFETPQDALKAVEGGVRIDSINLGSIAHSLGKVVLTKAVSMDKDDVEAFEKLIKLGVKIDVRKVPSDNSQKIEDILKKAKAELNK